MSDIAFPGDALRQRREELRYTPDDIYRDLHIPIVYLHALEAGRLDEMPAPTYALGFVRSYCIHLGINPASYVEAYRDATQELGRRGRSGKGEVYADRPGWWSEIRTWSTVCGVLLLLWITYMVVVPASNNSQQDSVQAGTHEVSVPAEVHAPPAP
jgi:cytoskeletal protein RodZ